jgi:IS5 family transposase
MAHRSIGQHRLLFGGEAKPTSSLDWLLQLIDWTEIAEALTCMHASAKGELAWPPLAMFKALLLSIWYDLPDVKLA